MSGMVHQPRESIARFDNDGNGTIDEIAFSSVTTQRATIINPNDPWAAVNAFLAMLGAIKHRPMMSAITVSGLCCVGLFGLGLLTGLFRSGEPEPVTTGIGWMAPQVLGTRLGYAVKTPFQGAAGAVGDAVVANENTETAYASQSASLKPRTRVSID